MLFNPPPQSNYQRQQRFVARNPGYYRKYAAQRRAFAKNASERFLAEARATALAEKQAQLNRAPLMLPAPVEMIEVPGMNSIAAGALRMPGARAGAGYAECKSDILRSMKRRAKSIDLAILSALLLITAAIFCTGITWGLPSRKVDPFLFGDHPVWSGAEIVALTGDRAGGDASGNVGADVDRNPLGQSRDVVVNSTDRDRAEIVRRYRLFTYQPDEMITMMALSGIKPSARQFDPKLYQYGGLWIYPVGALIKVFANPKASVAYYLDHPEAFATFYVIARAYVVLWGLAGAVAVYFLSKRNVWAVLCYALLPVVVNAAHEAKPHLPGAVLILLAVIFAKQFVETGLKRWWILAGIACGCACGMVLSAIPCLAILPVMTLLRKDSRAQRINLLVSTLVVAIDVYFLSNPYVAVHLLHDRTVLLSNLRNSQAMYQAPVSLAGVWNAAKLIAVGMSPWMLLVAMVVLLRNRPSTALRAGKRQTEVLILGTVVVLVLIQFIALATGKPSEYARFALLPDIALMMVAIAGVSRWKIAPIVLTAITAIYGISYLWHFERDAVERSTRIIAAERLRGMNQSGTLGIVAEPAPYSLPPVDLFKCTIVLNPTAPVDVKIRTTDHPDADSWMRPRLLSTPISWASKPYEVVVRQKPQR